MSKSLGDFGHGGRSKEKVLEERERQGGLRKQKRSIYLHLWPCHLITKSSSLHVLEFMGEGANSSGGSCRSGHHLSPCL